MRRLGLACLALPLALMIGACASQQTVKSPAPVVAAPSVAPAAPPPDPRAPLIARHQERAQALERDGDLRGALLEWRVALTIDPENAAVRASLTALESRIERAVTKRIEAGRAALGRSVQAEARRQFLAALALDPANRAAFQALQTQAREVEFVTHTVRQGETLATLAERYYGDRSRFEVIWETNQLPPNPRLAAGMTLKIPEIPGVPFIHPEARRAVPPSSPAAPVGTIPKVETVSVSKGDSGKEEFVEINPLLAEAREALERNDYAEALSDVEKFLAGSPSNRDGLSLKKQALYRQGKAHLSQKKFEDSYRALVQLAKLQPDYEDSPALLQQARARTIEQRYSQGVRLYREERLADAIGEWRAVLEIDPQNANARRNIDQAERLLKALEERKKK